MRVDEKMTTQGKFILLSGISGSGKTSFGKYLSKKFGFYFFEKDVREDEFWRELRLGVDNFVARWLNRHDHMCLEWGFYPPHLSYVLNFKNQGANIFWFTCDKHIARRNYLKAHPDDPKGVCWDAQFNSIGYAGLPTSDFHIIKTYRRNWVFKRNPIPFEELTPKILSKCA